jgi:hypothetical protein
MPGGDGSGKGQKKWAPGSGSGRPAPRAQLRREGKTGAYSGSVTYKRGAWVRM